MRDLAMKVTARAVSLLLPLVVLLGCASSRGPELLELTSWEPPVGQTCQMARSHGALGELVDTTAAATVINEIGPSDGALLLSVRAGREEGERFIHRIETTLPPAEADELEAALKPLYLDSRAGGRLLIRISGGELERMALGPSRTCPPAMANRFVISRMLTGVARTLRQEGTVNLRLQTDSTGALLDAVVHRSSGKVDFDAAVMSVAQYSRFHPAVVDERPVPVWVQMDFNVRFECSPIPPGEEWPPQFSDPCKRRGAPQ